MKRLVGGDYQLDLSPIEIEESVDGETYTSITDKSVLDQLTGLKSFIGKSSMIKPIWVKLLNGETDEIVATRGSLSTSDGTTFLIKVLLAGFILTLSVEFTQMLNEDDETLDDWYIDTNDAKYLLVSDTQSLAGELADFEGDVSITGDLSVTGDTEFDGDVKCFENIVDKDGHKRFVEGEVSTVAIEGITFSYAKWSLSGSHLMIVVCGTVVPGTYSGTIAQVTLPEWIFNKIQPVSDNYIEVGNKSFYYTYETQGVSIQITKATSTINIAFASSVSFTTNDRSFRIQYDLLIDNETTAP